LFSREASRYILMLVPHRLLSVGFMVQPINWNSLGFEDQTKKPSRWFWGTNHQTEAASFEAQTGKPSTTLVLRLNQETHNRFWGQTGRNRRYQFWGQTGENRRHQFWGQTKEIRPSGFKAKPLTNRRHQYWG
jgi:hypothetical protein